MTTTATAPADGYFDLDFYRRALAQVESWRGLALVDPASLPTPDDRADCERLLAAEARLIDAGRLADWLDLFTEDCAYWIPADVDGGDAARVVSWEFNDRRRMEERIERLNTGLAYSQIPPTRCVHLYSNHIMRATSPDEIEIICNFLIQIGNSGRQGQRAGWNGFLLRRTRRGWRIVMKRVSLFDADWPQNNNSFTL